MTSDAPGRVGGASDRATAAREQPSPVAPAPRLYRPHGYGSGIRMMLRMCVKQWHVLTAASFCHRQQPKPS
jgi:hypothetical protein